MHHQPEYLRLNPLALGLALGIINALSYIFIHLMMMTLWHSHKSLNSLLLISTSLWGYSIWINIIILSVESLFIGFFYGSMIAYLYNRYGYRFHKEKSFHKT